MAENVVRANCMGAPNSRSARKKLKRLTKEMSPDFNGGGYRLTDDIVKILEWQASGEPKTEHIEKLYMLHGDLLRILL